MADVEITNLKEKTVSGVLWKFGESILAQLVSFVVSIVLARLLAPEVFGTVSLLLSFINIANVFVTGGLGLALIQKKDADELDFSSVLFMGLFFSIVLYLIIFFCAPLIANAYNNQDLLWTVRVLALKLPIASIATVQQAMITRKMQFKKFFWATFVGTVISGVVGVWMAYAGFKLWALVAQYLTNSVIDLFILGIAIKWWPKFKISFKRFRILFKFGWKLLVSGLVDVLYSEATGLIIGLKYSSSDLAFYNRGRHLPLLISNNMTGPINSVLMSTMSKFQDDKVKVKNATRKSVRLCSYVVWPCMAGMAAIAVQFVNVILTPEWLPCVPYIYMACIIYAFYPIHVANLVSIQSIGRSDVYLGLEIVKKVVGVAMIAIFMWLGVFWLAFAKVISGIISVFINTFPTKKLIGYGIKEQLKDIVPSFLLSISMGIPIFLMQYIPINQVLLLVLQVLAGVGLYIGLSVITKNKEFYFLLDFLKGMLKKKSTENDKKCDEEEQSVLTETPSIENGNENDVTELGVEQRNEKGEDCLNTQKENDEG